MPEECKTLSLATFNIMRYIFPEILLKFMSPRRYEFLLLQF